MSGLLLSSGATHARARGRGAQPVRVRPRGRGCRGARPTATDTVGPVNIIFVEPSFPANQRRFVQALVGVGANVYGIGETEEGHLDGELREQLHGYYRVGSVTNVEQMTEAVRYFQERVWIDGLEAVVEAHTMPAAQVREATGIPGTSVHTTWLCRDKPSMKEALRQAGGPTAASAAVESAAEAHAFADREG